MFFIFIYTISKVSIAIRVSVEIFNTFQNDSNQKNTSIKTWIFLPQYIITIIYELTFKNKNRRNV